MEFINEKLTNVEILSLRKKYGNYIKLTVEVEKGWIVAGGEPHADGEKILLEKGAEQDNIWGGGIDFIDKLIDTTAVLNIRPRLSNDSMEILNESMRNKFNDIVKKYFAGLWN